MIRLLDHPRLPWFAALLSVILALPSLGGGIAADDWFHRAHLDPAGTLIPEGRGAILDLFAFFPPDPTDLAFSITRGILPWWTDPEIRGAFFRPLAALAHLVDWRVFGDALVLHHAHSLFWLGVCVLAAGGLFRAWFGEGRVAALATVLFALDDAHAWPAAWIANRNALLAMTFAALAGRAFLRRSALAPLWLAASLLSAEAGSATVFLLLALELHHPREGRLRRWVPLLAVTLAWAATWLVLGYGIRGSGLYLDPIGDPVDWLVRVPERIGALSAAMFLNAPVDFWVILPPAISVPLGVSLGIVTACVLGWAGAFRLPRAALVAALACLLPACAAFPMERVVTIAAFGGFGLLAQMLVEPTQRRHTALLFLHVPLSAVLLAGKSWGVPFMLATASTLIDQVPADPGVTQRSVVVVSGTELATAYVPLVRDLTGRPIPGSVLLLAPVATDLTVTREDERTLLLTMPRGGFRHAVERLCRSAPFSVGESVRTAVATMTVREVDGEGHPLRVRATFDRGLEDPTYDWFAPEGYGMAPWTPPKIGETVSVPPMLPLPG